MKTSLYIAGCITILSMTAAVARANNFRCPNGSIVSSGDSISEVMVKCDPPTNKIKRTDSDETFRGRVRYIEVEEWTYNEGPHTLVHYLTFRNGVLTEVKTGTFGR
ncbi:MAG: DUF2845 domain-containing protein [Verrucomicrobia bacterium]|nr:DUF2845 domain-containing protein [Deltaproteobacteria bacterium]